MINRNEDSGGLHVLDLAAGSVTEGIIHYLSEGARTGGGGGRQVAALMNHQVQGLALVRDPEEADLPLEQLRAVLRYWRSLPRVEGVPDILRVDPEALLTALGYIMLIDIDERSGDLRYALYGSKIAEVAGFDMTGKSVWDIPTTSPIQTFFAACYMAARQLKCALYTVHKAPPSITVSHWHRVILPIGAGGEVKRFLVCNMPIKDGELQ